MKRILGQSLTQLDIAAVPPVDDVGIDMTAIYSQSKPRWWLITVVVTVAPSDITVWGALAQGVPEDATDDVWGLHQDAYATFPHGRIATALPVGVYHFLTDNLGLYSRVYFQKSAGTVFVQLTEVLEAGRGN